jgi:hypothetical protein
LEAKEKSEKYINGSLTSLKNYSCFKINHVDDVTPKNLLQTNYKNILKDISRKYE